MSKTADLLVEIQRLTDALAKERLANAGLRAEVLRISYARVRLHGCCRACEYVPADLKPYTEPATERFHNGG